METRISRSKATAILKTLLGRPLLYALKSPDTELYDFGFGKLVERLELDGSRRKIATQTLHILCEFKVICESHHTAEKYDGFTSCDEFHSKIKYLIGSKIVAIELTKENDLMLNFNGCSIEFITFKDGEESWRFFTAALEAPHLVVSDSWLELN